MIERYSDGDVIVREGELGREMYLIKKGQVDVAKSLDGKQVVLVTLDRGSFFGEMSLLESLPRNATVIAKGNTELLVIEPGTLLMKIRRDPTFAYEMLQHMSRRIRDLDEQLMGMIRESDVSTSDESTIRISSKVRRFVEAATAERRP